MKTLVVVPAKDPARSKERLAPLLPAEARRALAEVLLDRTLAVLASLPSRPAVLVVTESADVEARARAAGADVLREAAPGADGGAGQTAAVRTGAARAAAEGYERLLALPADVAAPEADEIEALLAQRLPPPSVVLVPATGDDGTNAVLVAPPEGFPFRFGARSFANHLAAARAGGYATAVVRLPRLALDLDTPDDVRLFLASAADGPVRRLLERAAR